MSIQHPDSFTVALMSETVLQLVKGTTQRAATDSAFSVSIKNANQCQQPQTLEEQHRHPGST